MVPYVRLSTNCRLDNFITVKNIFSLHQKPILELVDSCTYGTIAFPYIKSSLFLLFCQIVNKLRFNCSCPVNHYPPLSLSLSLSCLHSFTCILIMTVCIECTQQTGIVPPLIGTLHNCE